MTRRPAPVLALLRATQKALKAERRAGAKLRDALGLAEAKYAAERTLRREAEAERDRALVVALEADPWSEWDRLLEEGWPA